MYYWSKSANNINLKEEFINMNNVRELYIGTAFISHEGIRLLKELVKKNSLIKQRVYVYISNEFSQDKPHELLEEICKIAQVKIFLNHTFHSKVYLLRGDVDKVVFGSSNFTSGGLLNNIEFDDIKTVEGNKLAEVQRFFEYCDFHSTLVNDDIIRYYKDSQKEIEELRQIQKKLRKKIKGYVHLDDAMDKDEYEINDYYFTFSDYETFFNRNATRDDKEIREQRKVVKDKMLMIHNKIYSQIQKLGINCHWNKNNVTSLIHPCEYNKGRVGWLGIRYGKTKNEVDIVNQCLDNKEKDEIKGFQKHGCLQFCIVPTGFEVNLFLAVRHDAIDRANVQDNMKQLEPNITKEIAKLQGHGMIWELYNDTTKDYKCFELDDRKAEEFCKFLKKYDRDGYESYLKLFYRADNKILSDINLISSEIIKYMTMLVPLYNAMVWRPKV
ncbi:phospholipase D family protein [Clostridium perfringens]|nr:phospholipase D family protein [Clostridium perfringens]MDU7068097.1 phospholipase D family protein [Clostridium perfringens]